ncbi:DUF2171 domain-containing protein [Sphingomonas sp. PB2P19]|uniref:DUF2171 domain-containing protein n=1 Tax=Sphingomonas rhamnosi TaxID=3096156 RepID=UPI002FC9A43B
MGDQRDSRTRNAGYPDGRGGPDDREYATGRDHRSGEHGREHGRGPDPHSQRGRDYYGNQPHGERDTQPPRGDRESGYHGTYADGRSQYDDRRRSQARPAQRGDHDDRGFIARAGDEVRSWFGDDEAEHRREQDARYDEEDQRSRAVHERDDHYRSWRASQIAALDADYAEYRQENRAKFDNEFGAWRTEREGQRTALSRVDEHMEVVGSDGAHVGTVDAVRGDRILLTRTDKDAGGVHHSIPSRWIQTVDTHVVLAKSADDAKTAWREEQRNAAASHYGDQPGGPADSARPQRATPDRRFTGTD